MKTAITLATLVWTASAAAAPTLGPAYGDHMVLQRDVDVVISGSAPGQKIVRGTLGTASAQSEVNSAGDFLLVFPAQSASEEGFALSVSDSSGTSTLSDILIGDVYLCAGQSNMELTVNRALDTNNQLRLAPDNGMRLLKIPKDTAPAPRAEFAEPVAWNPATSDSVAEFSAACFYMAKRLRADRPGVPVGLIHSNWGGSAARAWLTPAGGKTLYGQDQLELLALYNRDPLAAARKFAPEWYDWWRTNDNGKEPWKNPDALDWQPIPQFSFWNEWKGTGLDTKPQANVWLRQKFTLTAQQAKQAGQLSIGAIDDLDLTWVNGNPVGYTFGWGVERNYLVPAEALREGENEVLIAATNMWDTGGFFGGPDRLFFKAADGGMVPLGADWEYSIGSVTGVPPRAPWDANAGIGVMHNRMIAPLGPMRLAGVAWYQGESDVGQPAYDEKLRELFSGWRAQFGQQTRMLVVQLANYGQRRSRPAASGWAQLREEQLDGVAADRNAALVTAIDIGEPNDIHPANKSDLGKRLAMAAENHTMPMPLAAVQSGDNVTVTFTGVEGDLAALGGPYPLGVELCGDTQESCRFVLPAVSGSKMLIDTSDGLPATRVRYAWADAPIVNLYDARELPVPAFELPITR